MITLVFDLGGVLIQWNPRAMMQQVLPDVDFAESPLSGLFSSPEWLAHDRGETTEQAAFDAISARLPDEADSIAQIAAVWREHLVPIPETVALLGRVVAAGIPAYALSNFPRQAFSWVYGQYDWLKQFKGLMVSSHFGVAKPDPAFFALFLSHYGLEAGSCLFIDDHAVNIAAAEAAGMQTHLFTSPEGLADALRAQGIVV